jgi:hypothetical protein
MADLPEATDPHIVRMNTDIANVRALIAIKQSPFFCR